MSVNYAAVQDKAPWRYHKRHKTREAAIDGKDGARNLLLREGRVADMWEKYGDVQAVFVWDDDAEYGEVFRLDPERDRVLQSTTIHIDKILNFHKEKTCTRMEIAVFFCNSYRADLERGTVDTLHPFSSGDPTYNSLYPDELSQNHSYTEGYSKQVLVNQFERSPLAREKCITHYGAFCQVCNLDFSKRYGELGAGFIHVHHRVPLASIGAEYSIDPIKDLVPVCPNCHAMLHRQEPPLDIEELRTLIKMANHNLK